MAGDTTAASRSLGECSARASPRRPVGCRGFGAGSRRSFSAVRRQVRRASAPAAMTADRLATFVQCCERTGGAKPPGTGRRRYEVGVQRGGDGWRACRAMQPYRADSLDRRAPLVRLYTLDQAAAAMPAGDFGLLGAGHGSARACPGWSAAPLLLAPIRAYEPLILFGMTSVLLVERGVRCGFVPGRRPAARTRCQRR